MIINMNYFKIIHDKYGDDNIDLYAFNTKFI